MEGLVDVGEEVGRVLEADAEADSRVVDAHGSTLVGREAAEDSRSGMDGEGAAIEEVRGAADDLEMVDEGEGSLGGSDVDSEDSAGERRELRTRELLEGIAVEGRVVDA